MCERARQHWRTVASTLLQPALLGALVNWSAVERTPFSEQGFPGRDDDATGFLQQCHHSASINPVLVIHASRQLSHNLGA